jgi:hypothetical protein
MAKFRLLRAHYLPDDKYLLGDQELESTTGKEDAGTVVGDGTPHRITWPTLDMVALDEEGEAMLEKERERLNMDAGTMDPIEQLPMNAYEQEYIPGTNQRRRSARPHGASVKV